MNLSRLVVQAFSLGQRIAPEAFPLCRIRLGPTSVVDPVADTAETKWNVELRDIQPVAYDSKNRDDSIETSEKIFAFPSALFPSRSTFDQKGEVETGGVTWNATAVEADPSGSLILIHCIKQ